MLKNKKKILVVAAHPDDEVLGCGATIKYSKIGYEVFVLLMSDGESSRNIQAKRLKNKINLRRKACEKSCKVLGVKKTRI